MVLPPTTEGGVYTLKVLVAILTPLPLAIWKKESEHGMVVCDSGYPHVIQSIEDEKEGVSKESRETQGCPQYQSCVSIGREP